jgi:hypothetical protein
VRQLGGSGGVPALPETCSASNVFIGTTIGIMVLELFWVSGGTGNPPDH